MAYFAIWACRTGVALRYVGVTASYFHWLPLLPLQELPLTMVD